MDLILAGLQWSNCLVYLYLDDIIILGKDFNDHLSNIRSVFQRIRDADLILKPAKCMFFQEKVDYLGLVVSRSGVFVDPKKWIRSRIGQYKRLLGRYNNF